MAFVGYAYGTEAPLEIESTKPITEDIAMPVTTGVKLGFVTTLLNTWSMFFLIFDKSDFALEFIYNA